MELQHRNLSRGLQGPDVQLLQSELRLLGYKIRASELQEQIFEDDTEAAVKDFQRKRGLRPTGKADAQTLRLIDEAVKALPPRPQVVRGRVVFQHGKESCPLEGVTVSAFDKDLRREEPLGETTTDANGAYELRYTSEQFARAEKGHADLIVRVFSPEGVLLNTSELIVNASEDETVDLTVVPREMPEEPQLSEYEYLVADLAPILQDLSPTELTEEDIDFLVKETGADPDRVKLLIKAAGLAVETNLPTEVFYGFARRDLPLELQALRDQDFETLRDALLKAIEQNIIPAGLKQSLDNILTHLKEPREEQVYRETVLRTFVGRLLAEESGEPLVGYTVRAFDLEAGDAPLALGYEDTDSSGQFAFVYRTFREAAAEAAAGAAREAGARRDDDEGGSRHRLRLNIFDPQGAEIRETVVAARPDRPDVVEIRVPVPAAPETPSPSLDDLAEAISLELPAQLGAALAESDIRTLADIRRQGGLRHIEGLPEDDQVRTAVRRLEAHANLSVLSPEMQLNERLIERGYANLAAVAGATRPDFVRALRNEVGDFRAAQLHVRASAQHAYLNNVATHVRADLANGFRSALGEGHMLDLFPRPCGCDDCEAAVSPSAYLADLLDYVLTHLKDDGRAISLAFLTNNFHQPFGRLPASCEAVEEEVRQVRICIEVLRSYLEARVNPLDPAWVNRFRLLTQDAAAYRLVAYTTLLVQIGISYTELRLALSADNEKRQALADRLGISVEHLDELFLAPDRITEEALERLFGLVATILDNGQLPDPLRDPGEPELLAWRRAYLRALWHAQDWPAGPYTEQLQFRTDQTDRNDLDNGRLSAGLRQVFTDHDLTLSPNAAVVVVRQGQRWVIRDDPEVYLIDSVAGGLNVYSERRLPLIDPDVIGPDDLRHPDAGDAAFDLWEKRRGWVDGQLRELAAMTREVRDADNNPVRIPDVDRMIARMGQPVRYDGNDVTPWSGASQPADLDALFASLSQGTDVEAARDRIENDLRLSVESFSRLIEVWRQARRWEQSPTLEPVSEAAWREVRSILVQAQKLAWFPAWIQEEQNVSISFDSTTFWTSLREPIDGDWPPPFLQPPLVDPDVVGPDELPDPLFGRGVIRLWNDREAWLRDETWLSPRRDALRNQREANGYGAVLQAVFGDPLPAAIDELWNVFNQNLPDEHPSRVAARARLRMELMLDEERFRTLMEVRDRDADPNGRVTGDEWEAVYGILAGVLRRQQQDHQNWGNEETRLGLSDWQVFKARLPRWRASAEVRRQWQEVLRRRSRAPLVDPDLIDETRDFRPPASQNSAFTVYLDRRDWITQRLNALSNQPHGGNELAWLDTKVNERLGVALQDLMDLDDARQAGEGVERRLAQLGLTIAAFDRLLRIQSALAANQPVLAAEWEDVYAILVQVEKQRQFAAWRDEERARGITLSPDFFQIPELLPFRFPAPEPRVLPAWRVTRQERQTWEDTLQGRIDQERAVVEALRAAVSTTEEAALPRLRDALIRATDAAERKAKTLADRLLIDTQIDGCQTTTRISQAIETLQGLLWSLRTGQLQDTYPTLALDADNFEEEWQWIGSYATWRAAMFVFLYPENILLPSLRPKQTPAFQRLVRELRANRQLSPDGACRAARAFEDYFRDVCHLSVETSCQASTRVHRGACRDRADADYADLFYLFARGQETGSVYWSAYDPEDDTGYAQSFWTPIESLNNATRLIGAVPYERGPEQRFIYLFATVDEDGEQKLAFIRYDLEQQRLDTELTLLEEIPDEATTFTVVVKQHQRADNPPHLAVRVPSGAIYDRRLDREGTDWAGDDWRVLVGERQGAQFAALHAMIASGEGSFLLFVSDRAQRLQYKEFTEGLLELKPGLAAAFWHWSPSKLLVFVRGGDDALYSNEWDQRNAVWQQNWQSLGGFLTSDPVAVEFPAPPIEPRYLFALGSNNDLYYKSLRETSGQWRPLGITGTSRPSATLTHSQNDDYFLDVFIRGEDHALYHRRYITTYSWTQQSGVNWSQPNPQQPWLRLGSVLASAPAARPFRPDLIDIFVLNAQGELLRMEYDPTQGVMRTVSLGGTWTSDPAVVYSYVFVRGEDNALHYFRYFRNLQGVQATEWQQLNGEFVSSPAGVTAGTTLHVFARGSDDAIWHGRFQLGRSYLGEEDTWLGWQTIADGVLNAGGDQGWMELGSGTWLGAFQWAQSDEVYALWRDSSLVTRYAAIAPQLGVQMFSAGQSWLDSLAVHAGGSALDDATLIAYAKWRPWVREWVLYRYRGTFRRAGRELVEQERTPIAPRISAQIPDPFTITEKLDAEQRQERRRQLSDLFDEADSVRWPASILAYIEEAYYLVPVHLALQLQQRRHFISALDWFRNVYDYSRPTDERKIYHGLRREESLPAVYARDADWLLDPLDAHTLASTRANTYTRFTLLSLVGCFLDYADAEFTRDTSESVPRARTLYQTALELLALPELNQSLGLCSDIIGTLEIEVGSAIAANAPAWRGAWEALKADLSEIRDPALLQRTAQDLRTVFEADQSWAARFAAAEELVGQATAQQAAPPTFEMLIDEKPERLARGQLALLAQPEVVEATGRIGLLAGDDFLRAVSLASGEDETTLRDGTVELPWLNEVLRIETAGSTGAGSLSRLLGLPLEARGSRGRNVSPRLSTASPWNAVGIIRRLPGIFLPGSMSYAFCIPPNPVLQALRLSAELNLFKLRTCRNIAGLERQLEPYAAPTDTVSGLPQIGASGNLVLPGTVALQATPYRYQVLIERAKQLVQLSGQIEAAMLAALERRDAESYNLLQARQNVELTRAGIRLQDLRVREAESGVQLAELQRDRAQIQVDHFQALLDEGISALESASLTLLRVSVAYQFVAAIGYGVAAVLPSGFSETGIPQYSPSGQASALASSVSTLAGALGTQASILSTLASYERRAQDWEFQRSLANQDVRIGAQQVSVAEDHVRVVGQERKIADMQHDHAKETVDFLANKFTNVELYDWMSGVLEGVYSFFLQQATAVARLAETQLAFERQEIPSAYIQADYWEAPVEGGFATGTDGQAPERRGLTGSARLLQDIYQLDQYRFETEQRKLQLLKVLSLARLDPYAFQRFRETGVLPFNAPMELFDRDFPGHYLRLIKRVRVSVIALIPPTEGIRATLLNSGLSRAVVGSNGLFQRSTVRRPPESIALSSPINATGLFELAPQESELLLPFEGMGVDTSWELHMPKASNPFDYITIADVLITIEYTALSSFDYRQQVVQTLGTRVSADRPFSFRYQFADAWYDLHNPELTATPMTVGFETRRQDFPPNVEDLRIQHVVLYFTRAGGASFEIPVTHLHFTEQGTGGAIGGGATSVDGVISTRRGNAGSWTTMIGKPPIGEWELALPNTAEMRNRFKNTQEIEDILFVITYAGRTPEWPA